MPDSIGSNIAEGLGEIVKNTAKAVINVPSQIGKTAANQITGNAENEKQERQKQKKDAIKLARVRTELQKQLQSVNQKPDGKEAQANQIAQAQEEADKKRLQEKKKKEPILPLLRQATGEKRGGIGG